MNVLGSSSGVVRPTFSCSSPTSSAFSDDHEASGASGRVDGKSHPEVALGCIPTPVPIIIARAREPRHSSSSRSSPRTLLSLFDGAYLFYPATYGITRTPEIFHGGNKKATTGQPDAQHAMSAEASDWHPPQEGMHSHMARGPLASLSENVTTVPDGEEVRISRVTSFPSAVSSFPLIHIAHPSPSPVQNDPRRRRLHQPIACLSLGNTDRQRERPGGRLRHLVRHRFQHPTSSSPFSSRGGLRS